MNLSIKDWLFIGSIALLIGLVSTTSCSAQFPPQVVMVPQTTFVPYTLQSAIMVPPSPPRWVPGQWRLRHLENRVARRQAFWTRPSYFMYQYAPQQGGVNERSEFTQPQPQGSQQ